MTRNTTRYGRLASMVAYAVLALTTVSACGGWPGTSADATPPTASGGAVPDAGGGGDAGFGEIPAPEDEGTPDASEPSLDEQPPQPATEDCVSHDPANLTVVASGDAWILRDGGHSLKLFDTKADADAGRAVARNWTKRCFIGRGNERPDRYRYIISYWRDHAEPPIVAVPLLNCIPYNPSQLAIYSGAPHPADPTQSDWALYTGGTPLLFLATEQDALRAKIVADEHTKLCIIGHGNDRPDPARYLLHYWLS